MQINDRLYIKSINKVIDYIERNITKTFTLDELSDCANFSKFHFNRIFHSIVKESPFQFIMRLRLEKSASLLLSRPNESLSEIAAQCGFSDLSVFSRNFKKYFNSSPSVYKREASKNSNIRQIDSNDQQANAQIDKYFCPDSKTVKWISNMEIIKNVEVLSLPQMTVAYTRNLGPYNGNNELYQKHREELLSWAAARDLMNYEDFKYLILYHDNPTVALNSNQRMSLCVVVPPDTLTTGTIGKMDIEKGKYVVCQLNLSAKDFPKAWDWIFNKWFPDSGYVPDNKPYFEVYPEQPKGEIFRVDICIPVKPVKK